MIARGTEEDYREALMETAWTTAGVLMALYVAVAVMLIVVLYHVLFIVVDLRKILRRIESITRQLESVIIKPLSVADKAFQWMIEYFEGEGKSHHKKHLH